MLAFAAGQVPAVHATVKMATQYGITLSDSYEDRRPPMTTPFVSFHARAIRARWCMFFDARSLQTLVAVIPWRGLVTFQLSASVSG